MYLVVILLLLLLLFLFIRYEKCMEMMMFVVAIYKNVLLSFIHLSSMSVITLKMRRESSFCFVWRFINLFTSELFSFFISNDEILSKKKRVFFSTKEKPYFLIRLVHGEFVLDFFICLVSNNVKGETTNTHIFPAKFQCLFFANYNNSLHYYWVNKPWKNSIIDDNHNSFYKEVLKVKTNDAKRSKKLLFWDWNWSIIMRISTKKRISLI